MIRRFYLFMLIFVIFLLGWNTNNLYNSITDEIKVKPFSLTSNELKSPGDWIKEDSIHIKKDGISFDIENPTWAKFTDTNSMDPVIDINSNSIEIHPREEDLSIGDVISYKPNFTTGTVIHRIVDIKEDSEGKYFIVKGDNNNAADPEKVRYDQIKGVVVAIIY